MFGKYVTTEELFNFIKKGEEFFRMSGGGVTLGGGEPTFQPVFSNQLMEKCKKSHINIAFDTCVYTTSEGVESYSERRICYYMTLSIRILRSISCMTGVSNKLILKNLKELNEMKKINNHKGSNSSRV
jgi:pyruvate formate lyase activating enzyme